MNQAININWYWYYILIISPAYGVYVVITLKVLHIFSMKLVYLHPVSDVCICDILPVSISAAAHHHHHHHHHEGGMKSAHCSSEPRLTENDVSPGIRRRGSRRGQSMHHTHQRKSNAFLDVPDVSSQMPPREEGEDEDSYRLRSFSLTSKGQKLLSSTCCKCK